MFHMCAVHPVRSRLHDRCEGVAKRGICLAEPKGIVYRKLLTLWVCQSILSNKHTLQAVEYISDYVVKQCSEKGTACVTYCDGKPLHKQARITPDSPCRPKTCHGYLGQSTLEEVLSNSYSQS